MTPARRFQRVSCSQCGQDFGPGESGFSHCRDHRGVLSAADKERIADHQFKTLNYMADSLGKHNQLLAKLLRLQA